MIKHADKAFLESEKKESIFRRKAEEFHAKAGGDRSKAVRLFRQWLLDNEDVIVGEVWQAMAHLFAGFMVGDIRHAANRASKGKPPKPQHPNGARKGQEVPPKTNREARRRALQGASRPDRVFDWLSFSTYGTRLGELTREQLVEDAGNYRRQGSGSLEMAIMEEKIAGRLKDEERVKDRLTNNQLQSLYERCQKEARKLCGV